MAGRITLFCVEIIKFMRLPKQNIDILGRIHHSSANSCVPLRPWARAIAATGMAAYAYRQKGSRLVIAVTVPTRVLAAAMGSLGVVLASLSAEAQRTDESLLQEHFENLASLPARAPLNLRNRDRLLYGEFLGVCLCNGEPRIRIQVENSAGGGLTHLINKDQAINVQVAKKRKRLPKRQKGTKIRDTRAAILGELFPDRTAIEILQKDDVVLVGRASNLRDELTGARLAVKSSRAQWIASTIQDIVRVDKFCKDVEVFRTRIFSVDRVPSNTRQDKTRVTLFDGSTAFIKTRHYWPNTNWFVILDRTDGNFENAVEVLNGMYSQVRVASVEIERVTIPPGMEILAFTTKAHD